MVGESKSDDGSSQSRCLRDRACGKGRERERKISDGRGKTGRKEKRPLHPRRCADRLIEAGTKFHLGRDEWRERARRAGKEVEGTPGLERVYLSAVHSKRCTG